MKKLLLLIFFLMHGIAVSQEQSALPPARYTLTVPDKKEIGSDIVIPGASITLSGDAVRKFAPDLAAQFHPSMAEGTTATLVLPQLDGQALHTFKALFEEMTTGNALVVNKFSETAAQFQKKIDETALHSGKQAAERQQSFTLEQEKQIALAKIQKEAFQLLQKKAELLPNIGDHILELLNIISSTWHIYALEKVLATIVAENQAIVTPEEYQKLSSKGFSPRAQLLILSAYEPTLDTIINAYSWLTELAHNPLITADTLTAEILAQTTAQLNSFISNNIVAILSRYPDFKRIFSNPTACMVLIAQNLRSALLHNSTLYNQNLFRRIIKCAINSKYIVHFNAINSDEFMVDTLADNNEEMLLTVFNKNGEMLRSIKIPVIRKKYYRILSLGKKVIIYSNSKEFFCWNIETNQLEKVLTPVIINRLLKLSETQIILENIHGGITYYRRYDLNTKKFSLLKELKDAYYLTVLDADHILYTNDQRKNIFLFNIATKTLQELPFKPTHQFNTINNIFAIDNTHVVLQLDASHYILYNTHSYLIKNFTEPLSYYRHQVLSPRYISCLNNRFYRLNIFDLETLKMVIEKQFLGIDPTLPLHTDIEFFTTLGSHYFVYQNKNSIVIEFIPEIASLQEILDEIQSHIPAQASQRDAHDQPSLKRAYQQEQPQQGSLEMPIPNRQVEEEPPLKRFAAHQSESQSEPKQTYAAAQETVSSEEEQEPEIMTIEEAEQFAQRRAAHRQRKAEQKK